MKRHNQLYGMLMYPCSTNQKDHEATIFSSDYAKKKNFKKEYQNHMAGMQILAESAKIYILNNWKKVKKSRWKYLDISVVDNTGKETWYYNHEVKQKEKEKRAKEMKASGQEFKSSIVAKRMFGDLEKRRAKEHNPIISIKGVVLDTSDGDFSFDINGNPHLWVDDKTVIIMANFIEEELNKKKQK